MKTAGTIMGVVIVMVMIWFVTKRQLWQAPPRDETINEVVIKSDLLAIARAEKKYLASHGTYGSINELQQNGLLSFSGLRWGGYFYAAVVDDGQHFKITARPAELSKARWPVLSIDETLQVSEYAGLLF
jgi:hypothetical protein